MASRFWRRGVLVTLLAALTQSAFADSGWGVWKIPDAGCTSNEAWYGQENPLSDPTGMRNVAYPESDATYWATVVTGSAGEKIKIKGSFPLARYMGLQLYDANHNVVDSITDQDIVPDSGTTNLFQLNGDDSQGSYTVTVKFAEKPSNPKQNMLYAGDNTQVALVYRVYAPNKKKSLFGSTSSPRLPRIKANGSKLGTCAPRPLLDDSETVNGHIDEYDFTGTAPTESRPAYDPPLVLLSVASDNTPFYASADNDYMSTMISREYLQNGHNMVVMRMRAPSFPDTENGEAPWLAQSDRQVRLWSVCSNDPLSTGVARCLLDHDARTLDGFVTVVFSDPSNKPSKSTLETWGANWLPLGALLDNDVVYDIDENPLTNADGVYYYSLIIYRQVVPNPSWSQSMQAVSHLPAAQRRYTMGDYWPEVGYCKSKDFKNLGPACIDSDQ